LLLQDNKMDIIAKINNQILQSTQPQKHKQTLPEYTIVPVPNTLYPLL